MKVLTNDEVQEVSGGKSSICNLLKYYKPTIRGRVTLPVMPRPLPAKF